MITKIHKSKVKDNSYSIYIDGKYFCSVNDEVLYKSGLKEGLEIDEEDAGKLLSPHKKSMAMDAALRYLGIRARSKKELQQYLKKKEYSESVVSQVLARLAEMKYVDDNRFARDWATYRKNQKKGRYLISNELKRKGIDSELIVSIINSLYDDSDQETEQIKEIVKKKLLLTKNMDKKKAAAKIMGFLARRGFSLDKIMPIVYKSLKVEKPEDESE